MKKALLLSAICIVCITTMYAQSKAYPQPQELNTPYLYNPLSNALTELEAPDFKTENRRVGIWGKQNVIVIRGIKSNVRVSKKAKPAFVVQFDIPNSNPYAECELNVCTTEGQREFVDVKSGYHGSEKQETVSNINFEKIGTDLYLITLPKNISTGEYFFRVITTNSVYAFGLDK